MGITVYIDKESLCSIPVHITQKFRVQQHPWISENAPRKWQKFIKIFLNVLPDYNWHR